MLPSAFSLPAFAVGDNPPLGTWPDGSKGDTINVAAAVPRTGTYAVQGEDELKGWQLAVEHINNGDPLLKKIAPKVTKGLLGKKVNLLAADSAAKPNQAVQEIQTFINQNKIVLMTGSTSSAVAVALNKFAQREKVLYVTGISGSNDTTGKDCVRYGFRQNFYIKRIRSPRSAPPSPDVQNRSQSWHKFQLHGNGLFETGCSLPSA